MNDLDVSVYQQPTALRQFTIPATERRRLTLNISVRRLILFAAAAAAAAEPQWHSHSPLDKLLSADKHRQQLWTV